MSQQVEKLAHEEQPAHDEVVLVVTDDVPEEEEETDHEDKLSLLVPEPELLMNIPLQNSDSSSCNNEHEPAVKTQHKSPQPQPVEGQISSINIATNYYLPENEKRAILDLKHLLQQALNTHEFSSPKQKPAAKTGKDPIPGPLLEDEDGAKTLEAIEETIIHSNPIDNHVSIWGVKLLEDDKTDVILLKFLRARDMKVNEAFTMLKYTIKWRKEFRIDELVEQDDVGSCELERAVFMDGFSKEGHPVCYNVYGVFGDKEIYQKMFSSEEKRREFLRWRIVFLEKGIRKLLDFRAGGVSTIVHVNDLKNSPGPNRWELRQATTQALQLFQDNYPEFVAKQVFINVPWWYLALSKMISPFLTQRTKSKFVVAGPSGSTETLLKYISAEQIPAQFGGLSKDGDFGSGDCVTQIILKPSGEHVVEFPVTQEACIVKWEARVVGGWDVSYEAEFVPSAEDGYTIIIQKLRRINHEDEQVISSSYKAVGGEAGKLVLTFKNPSSNKKILLYRFKTVSFFS